MTDSMRAKIEQVIRTYGNKDAPVSPSDIRAELGLAGRDKISNTLNRMMRVVKGLQRVQKQNEGAPPHFCYWIDEKERAVTGDVQVRVLRVVTGVKGAVSCDQVAKDSGLTVRQVISNSSKLCTKKKIKRSVFNNHIFLRHASEKCPYGHNDYGFDMFKDRTSRTCKPALPKVVPPASPIIAPVQCNKPIIRIQVQGKVMEFELKEARDIHNQLKEIFE